MLNKIVFSLVCITAIATTMAYGTVHQPIIVLFYLMTAAMALLWAAGCLVGGQARVSRSTLQVPLLLLGLYAVVQIIPLPGFGERQTISVEPFSTYLTAVHIFILCLFFAIALASLDSAGRLRRTSSVFVIFGFIYAFYAILQSVLSPERIYGVYDPASAMPFGSFVNRHDFAALMNMVVSIPLGLIFAGAVPRDKRLLYVVSIALIGTAVLLSGSRGGLVSLVAAILIVLILTTRSQGRKTLFVRAGLSLLLLIAAVGGAVFVGGDTSLTRFSDAASASNISSSRFEIWATTLKLISDHMPLGAGLGAYAQAYTRYDTMSGLERIEQAHNDYLQIAADAGIVGVLIGGLFLFWFFREGARNSFGGNTLRRGIAVGAFAGCFAVLIHSIFDFVLHITAISVMFLTLLAMLVASGREFDDDIDEFDTPERHGRRRASVTSIDETSRATRRGVARR